MVRVDHQINANNTYTARYLTERQPNRDLLTGDRATLSTANYELDIDQTASVAYNRVFGTTALNTLRASMETEDIQRGAEPGDFLETNRKDLELPVLRFLSFDEQGHINGQHRNAQAPGPRRHVQLVRAGKRRRPRSEIRISVPVCPERLYEQGSMNGVFTFPGDRAFNAADPSTYPERLSIRVPVPAGVTSFTHSFAFFAQDKWRITPKLTLNLGLRYDVDIFPFRQAFNPLLDERLSRRQEQLPAARRLCVRRGWAIGYSRRDRALLREVLHRSGLSRFKRLACLASRSSSTSPSSGRSGAERGTASDRSDARQRPGREPRAAQPALSGDTSPETRARCSTIRQIDRCRNRPRCRLATSGRLDDDVVRRRLRSQRRTRWVGYDLNPGLRVDTTRTGAINRTDLLGLASQLGISPFSGSVNLRFDYTGKTKYDGLNLQLERRFAGFWSARTSYTLGYARGNNSGAPWRQQLPGAGRAESRLERRPAGHRPAAQLHAQRPPGSAADRKG